jgi:predicted PurR-regulated permease PerM
LVAGSGVPDGKTPAPANFAASREQPVGEIIKAAGAVAWAFVGLAVAIAILGWVGAQISIVFPPLVLAGMIVFLLNPIVTWMQGHGVHRAAGAGIAYLGFFAFVTLLVVLAVPAIQDQAQEFGDHWPEVRSNIEHWVDERAAQLEGTPFEFDREEIVDRFTQNTEIDVGEAVGRATEIGFQILEILLIFIIAPILAFYMLIDLPHLRRVAEGLIPEEAREDVVLVARRVNHAVGGFFRGQLVVAFIVGVLSSVGLWLIDLPFWLIIGMVAGFFNLVPLIGPWVGGVPAVLIALTTREPITAVWAALVLLVVQQIDNHFISPVVMSRAVKLHPVVVMVVLLLGGSLFGFFGLLVAVPATAVLKIVFGHLWRVRVLGQTPEEWYWESEATDEIAGVGFVERVPVEDA